ncbi:hypothetical protein C8R48DRAFT_780408 [Suillus tomentosus]|nr:hypothetical protein C8R48DRAFT_780408 [Suillus tomentosus]
MQVPANLFFHWLERPASSMGQSSSQFDTPRPSVHLIDLKKGADPTDRVVTCLLAEDNPITAKILETLFILLGCEWVRGLSDIKFECTLMDSHMSVVDGEGTARYIKTTSALGVRLPLPATSSAFALYWNNLSTSIKEEYKRKATAQISSSSTLQGRDSGNEHDD